MCMQCMRMQHMPCASSCMQNKMYAFSTTSLCSYNGGISDALSHVRLVLEDQCLYLGVPKAPFQQCQLQINMSPLDDILHNNNPPMPAFTIWKLWIATWKVRGLQSVSHKPTNISTWYESLHTWLHWITGDHNNQNTDREIASRVSFTLLSSVHLSPQNQLHCFSQVRTTFKQVLVYVCLTREESQNLHFQSLEAYKQINFVIVAYGPHLDPSYV